MQVERLGVLLKPENKAEAKFNAGMVRCRDTVHMLYRYAVAEDYKDGKSIVYSANKIYYARLDTNGRLIRDYSDKAFIEAESEAEKMGCEDPRIVEFEGWYYIFYSAFDGETCRVGVARTSDFTSVEKLGVIPTVQWDKDAFIFPERIDGKIVYMHRIEPDIEMDTFSELEDMFSEDYWREYENKIHEKVVLSGAEPWENLKIGGSVPPIKTEIGWLLIYHGVADDRDPFCYRAGAALLDLNNPSRVISRLPFPLLEPEKEYECVGDVNNVVFPQGAFIENEWLYISYGAADKYVAMARVKYGELLEELKKYIKE